jgi:hypothetical protein
MEILSLIAFLLGAPLYLPGRSVATSLPQPVPVQTRVPPANQAAPSPLE